jgi:SAM-dependent methyltransferase
MIFKYPLQKKFKCNICENNSHSALLDLGKQPIVHHLKKLKTDKEYKFPFELVVCKRCKHCQIKNPIDEKVLYENYYTPSLWKNAPHLDLLIKKSISIYNLENRAEIFDIGANDGSFLNKFKTLGFKKISGVEPAQDVHELSKKSGLKIYNDYFSYKFLKKIKNKKFDIVFARHVLEHIHDLNQFLECANRIIKTEKHGGRGGLVIEVPDHSGYIENLDYTFWEEHVNYFTIDSLRRVLNQNNFRIIHSETTLFSGRTIMLFAEKKNNNNLIFYKKEKNKYNLEKKKKFFIKFEEFKKKFNSFLIKNKKDFIVYGCGARSSNFVNFLNNSKKIKYFVDDNKEKQDLFVPGCNLFIKKFSKNNIKNKIILVGVNTENENIILKKCLKLKVKRKDIFSILPPSKILIPFWKKMIDNFR